MHRCGFSQNRAFDSDRVMLRWRRQNEPTDSCLGKQLEWQGLRRYQIPNIVRGGRGTSTSENARSERFNPSFGAD